MFLEKKFHFLFGILHIIRLTYWKCVALISTNAPFSNGITLVSMKIGDVKRADNDMTAAKLRNAGAHGFIL